MRVVHMLTIGATLLGPAGLASSGCHRAGSGDATEDAKAGPRALPAPEPAGMSPEAYDSWRQPAVLVAALELEPGQVVADVGAGRGYLTERLAREVGPRGRVVATDIDATALAAIPDGVAGQAPIETRWVVADDPGLEAGRYDVVVMAQVDHLLGDPAAYLMKLRAALAPGGRVAVQNRIHHRARVVGAAARARYHILAEHHGLPGQFLIILGPSPEVL